MPEIRRLNSDYEVHDRETLSFIKGELAKVGKQDRSWNGWVWVWKLAPEDLETARVGTYVPNEIVVVNAERQDLVEFKDDFNASDLSAKKGELITSLRENHGWHWCRNESGREGWLPGFVLSSPV